MNTVYVRYTARDALNSKYINDVATPSIVT